MDWLLQNLFSSLVWEILLLLGVGIALERLRAKWPVLANRLLYGIAGATCVAVLLFAFTGHGLMYKRPPEPISEENVEDSMKLWADHLAMSLERQSTLTNDAFFSYVARLHGGDPVEVFRGKEKPGYLQFKATINMAPEHQAVISKLSPRDYTKFLDELNLELSRLRMSAGVGVSMDQKGQFAQLTVLLQKAAPISSLNEGYFADRFDEVTGAVSQVRAAVNLALGISPIPVKQPVSR